MYIVIYNFGTSSLKTCLFEVEEKITLAASSTASYGLNILENGGAEQDLLSELCKAEKSICICRSQYRSGNNR